jgi:hypothetical protein
MTDSTTKIINDLVQPRVIRLKDAPRYMGTNINFFNQNIRRQIPEIRYSKQSIGFDRLDLDRWIEDHKQLDGCLAQQHRRHHYG